MLEVHVLDILFFKLVRFIYSMFFLNLILFSLVIIIAFVSLKSNNIIWNRIILQNLINSNTKIKKNNF